MEGRSKMIPTYILTNNHHLFLLPGFAHLWNKYCGSQVVVFGFDKPIGLPNNFYFQSLGAQLPASKWSNGLIQMLDRIGHLHFILMLEDYWLYQSIDANRINKLANLMNDDILRIDLSGNRASYKSAVEIMPGIVETPLGTPYQMSFQAAIWHKDNLRRILRNGENPWQSEIEGSKRVDNLRVLGTRPATMHYQPVWRTQQQRWQLDKMKTNDIEYLKGQGWLDVPEARIKAA
jgi:hypothetical protein